MKTKEDIVSNWLTRYTGQKLEDFGSYILLTNFRNYLDYFTKYNDTRIADPNANMPCATADGITMIDFGKIGRAHV